MIEEIGVITAVDKDHIWVETQIKTTCGTCQAQDHCGTGTVAKAFAPKTEKLILRCKQPAQVGQQVKLGIEEQQLLGASALMYLLPLFTLVAVALGAQALLPKFGLEHELWIVASAFLATYGCFRWLRKHAQGDTEHRFQPKLISLLPVEQTISTGKPIS